MRRVPIRLVGYQANSDMHVGHHDGKKGIEPDDSPAASDRREQLLESAANGNVFLRSLRVPHRRSGAPMTNDRHG